MNEGMTLSSPGETYLKACEETNGKCRLKAYNDGTGKATIAWGCTHGVTMGMTITLAQGQAMFDKEIAGIEEGLLKWLTREVDQDTWDYCVFFGYNLGWGKCGSFQKAVNGGNDAKIRAAAMLFTHGYSQAAGRIIEWPGLVSRRKQELNYYDTHHNLTKAELPKPVAPPRETPAAQSLPPAKPSIWLVLLQSRTIKALTTALALLVATIQGWINEAAQFVIPAADYIPSPDEVQSTIDTSNQVAGWFKLDIQHFTIWIVVAGIAYAIIRKAIDKHSEVL